MSKQVRTDILKIERQPIFYDANAASASVWFECIKIKEMYDYAHGYPRLCDEGWLDKMLSKTQPLHSQSIQAVRKRYFEAWRSFFALCQSDAVENPRPPTKPKQYVTTRWLTSAIRFSDNPLLGKSLRLAMGRGRQPIEIPLPKSFDLSKTENISTIDLVNTHGQWSLHFTYTTEPDVPEPGDGVVGVDVGEIHPMVTHDGSRTHVYNGRYIRSLYRLRNRVLAKFSARISKHKRHSKSWWRLTKRKWRRIRKIDNQIKNAIHQHTAKFVKLCHRYHIGTIVVGELKGIRKKMDYGKRANQKLHQWPFAKLIQTIAYKAKAFGMKVIQIDESYTSQTCPSCLERHKPRSRDYTCKCGFSYHRDGVGAINIRKKYLGQFDVPVVAAMTPPVGIRLRCPVSAGNVR